MTGVLAEQEASGESPDNATVVDDKSSDQSEVVVPRVKIPFRSKVTLAILVFINLLNYMDRYSLAGIALLPISTSIFPLLSIFFMSCDGPHLTLLQTAK